MCESTTTPPLSRRGCNLTTELRRKGAAQLTREQRSAGGKARVAQPSFRELQRRRGRKGAAVCIARHGVRFHIERLVEWRRAHPTDLELFVATTLQTLYVGYFTQVIVEVVPGITYWTLDFLVPGRGPGGVDLVIEPGHRRWHGGPDETLDGTDRAARDAARNQRLAALGYPCVLMLTDTEITEHPEATAARIAAFVRPTAQRQAA
jgi:hypothetical protein